jgi:hypothetical protein
MIVPKRRAGARDAGSQKLAMPDKPTNSDNNREALAEQVVAIDWNGDFTSVHHGRKCVGHIFKTARGFLVVDASEKVIGYYESYKEGRTALSAPAGVT